LLGELVAADHATSHIGELAAARTYNRAVRQALVGSERRREVVKETT
jgi:hypothetical protein